jgi:hypothetical protein
VRQAVDSSCGDIAGAFVMVEMAVIRGAIEPQIANRNALRVEHPAQRSRAIVALSPE